MTTIFRQGDTIARRFDPTEFEVALVDPSDGQFILKSAGGAYSKWFRAGDASAYELVRTYRPEVAAGVLGLRLTVLQAQVAEWHARELSPRPDPFRSGAKVSEEAGEFLAALIKIDEDRNDGIDWKAEAYKEMGDVLIALCGAAFAHGWSLSAVVAARWETISQRRYATRESVAA